MYTLGTSKLKYDDIRRRRVFFLTKSILNISKKKKFELIFETHQSSFYNVMTLQSLFHCIQPDRTISPVNQSIQNFTEI